MFQWSYNLKIIQVSKDIVNKQLKELSLKLQTTIQPMFVSCKIDQELKVQETRPLIVNQPRVVYRFQCDLCDALVTRLHAWTLHEHVEGHKHHSYSIS